MKLLSSLFVLGTLCGVAAGDFSPVWPQNGVVKVTGSKSPASLSISMPKCLDVTVDWKAGSAVAAHPDRADAKAKVTGMKTVPTGGQYIVLMARVQNGVAVVLNLESKDGTLLSETMRVPMGDCNLSKVVVAGDGHEGLKAFVTDEILNLKKVDARPCLSDGMKYVGTPISQASAADANACQGRCGDDAACEAFVFNKSTKSCTLLLAGAESQKVADPQSVSGPKKCSGCYQMDSLYEGSKVLKRMRTGPASPEECQLRCQATDRCLSWSFDLKASVCTLLSSAPGAVRSGTVGVVVGPKYCNGSCALKNIASPCLVGDITVREVKNVSVEQCSAECAKDEKCDSFTHQPDKSCYLKGPGCVTYQSNKQGATTGFKQCSTCLRQGLGYAASGAALLWQVEALNPELCRAKCAMSELCTRFTWDGSKKMCYLFSGEGEAVKSDILVSGPWSCEPSTACFQKDVRYDRGVDVSKTPGVPDAKACQEMCAKSVACEVFTYNTASKECILKKEADVTKVKAANWVSGHKKCLDDMGACIDGDVDYPMDDITSSGGVQSDAACKAMCQGQPGCRVYTWNKDYNHCYMKRASAYTRRTNNRMGNSGGRAGCGGCVAGAVMYDGSIIRSIILPSFAVCQHACEAEPECRYWAHSSRLCHLLRNKTGQRPAHTDEFSGPKRC